MSWSPHTLSQPGFAIAPNFLGLSFEIQDAINDPRSTDPALEQFLINLGPGVPAYRRDQRRRALVEPHDSRRSARTGRPVIVNADFATLFAFSRAVGWQVIYTVNLANLLADTAAAEVQGTGRRRREVLVRRLDRE